MLALVVLAGTGWYVTTEVRRAPGRAGRPDARSRWPTDVLDGPHVLFRGTAPGELYGRVAAVALDDLSGPREVTPAVCDRVDSDGETTVCLHTARGVVTTYEAEVLDAAWRTTASWPLPGIPSRTRLSPDGLVATTAFVTGHSYAAGGLLHGDRRCTAPTARTCPATSRTSRCWSTASASPPSTGTCGA